MVVNDGKSSLPSRPRNSCNTKGQRLMGETKWEKGVETASCDFLRFPALFCDFLRLQTTYLADQGPNLQKSAKIFDKLPFLPFSLSHFSGSAFGQLARSARKCFEKCLVRNCKWPMGSQFLPDACIQSAYPWFFSQDPPLLVFGVLLL